MANPKPRTTRPLNVISNSIAEGRGCLLLDSHSTVVIRGEGNKDYICGYCDAVLIQGQPNVQMVNAALKCNACGTFNDYISKPLFKKRPPMLKDTFNVVLNEPVHRFKSSPFMDFSTYSTELMGLSDTILASFMESQMRLPTILNHYTSYSGLTGIISNNSLWATDIAYMNDSSELSYGKELIDKYLDEKSEISPEVSELMRRSRISVDATSPSRGYYVCCFCENNDLLSQWRAYGGGGSGYSLGFSLAHIPVKDNIHIRKVVYDRSIQKKLIEEAVDKTIELFQRFTKGKSIGELDALQILPGFSSFLESHLMEYIFTFKHPAFEEENEVRIIYDFRREDDLSNVKFRSLNDIPVPYLELTLGSEDKRLPILPLVRVTHGPTHHPQLVKKSLSLLLEKYKYQHVEITGSTTPMRV